MVGETLLSTLIPPTVSIDHSFIRSFIHSFTALKMQALETRLYKYELIMYFLIM